ncbi:MAG: hypothetical protein Fur005_38850 [Roseiflexaceae bacterium]
MAIEDRNENPQSESLRVVVHANSSLRAILAARFGGVKQTHHCVAAAAEQQYQQHLDTTCAML